MMVPGAGRRKVGIAQKPNWHKTGVAIPLKRQYCQRNVNKNNEKSCTTKIMQHLEKALRQNARVPLVYV